jgi:hypothetical protein
VEMEVEVEVVLEVVVKMVGHLRPRNHRRPRPVGG